MKTWLIAALMVGVAGAFVPSDADARRLGGGRPAGMQRAAPDKPAQPQTPAQPAATPNNPGAPAAAAAPATTGAAAAAAAPKRSWMGPIAGLAAGIGLAALFTHLGWGEGLANFVMLMLLALIAVVAIRWLMRRFAGGASAARERTPFAMAGAGAPGVAGSTQALRTPLNATPASTSAPAIEAPAAGALQTAAPASLPADFDAAAFERIAKMIFIRLQAANDKADVNDLRAFTTPELFSSLKLDLQERDNAAQQTDVVTLNAELLDFAQENARQIVSVRFHGLIREEAHNGAEPFDEVWHLVRPTDAKAGAWAIAGIQPRQ
jgi:predicted lipid-binding transport protein (Tim44 family)